MRSKIFQPVTFEIRGFKPVAKKTAAPSETKKGRFNPSKKKEVDFAWLCLRECPVKIIRPGLSCNIFLAAIFYFKMPGSWSEKKRQKMNGKKKGNDPDLKNLVWFLEDALQGIFWKDDNQITSYQCIEKRWADFEGYKITFGEDY